MNTRKKTAFTLIELLVVVSIIGLLVAILLPALGAVRKNAKEVKVKAMLHAITTGLEMFQNEHGAYPSSNYDNALDIGGGEVDDAYDNGAQRLVEALAGIDLLGYTASNNYDVYITGDDIGMPTVDRDDAYVDVEKMDIINFRQIYDEEEAAGRDPDVAVNSKWDKLNVSTSNANLRGNYNPIFETAVDGKKPRPILYFKAIKNRNAIGGIYNFANNWDILTDEYSEGGYLYPNCMPCDDSANDPEDYDASDREDYEEGTFEAYIWDGKTGVDAMAPMARPFKKDSFILLTAGFDGLYGTGDDICNFTKK